MKKATINRKKTEKCIFDNAQCPDIRFHFGSFYTFPFDVQIKMKISGWKKIVMKIEKYLKSQFFAALFA